MAIPPRPPLQGGVAAGSTGGAAQWAMIQWAMITGSSAL